MEWSLWISSFWTVDSPALGGVERILLYGALLIVCQYSYLARPPLGDSPLQAPELFDATDLDLFFEFRGLVELIPKTWLRAMKNKGTVFHIRDIVYVSWALCILGAFGHFPVLVTSAGMLFLEMIKISCTGVGHRMHLVVYMLVFLSLSNGRRSYSVDDYLNKNYPDIWPSLFNPHTSHPIFYSGLSTKLGLVASSFTLWVGALTKIRNGGWRWLDGSTLAWQTLSSPFGALPLMKRLFAIPAFATFSAIVAVVFEGGSFIIQFPHFKPWRFIWMLMCFKFHFVIYLTMNPNYLPQSITYIPCILTYSEEQFPPHLVHSNFEKDPFGFVCIAGATTILLALFVVALFQIESWPLTCVPMYSYYRGQYLAAVKAQDNPAGIESVGITSAQLQDLAYEFRTINPRCIGWLDSWVDVRIVYSSSEEKSTERKGTRGKSPGRKGGSKVALHNSSSYSLREYIRKGRAMRSAYRLALSKVLCQTVLLNGKTPSDTINPAVAFLELLCAKIPRLKADVKKIDAIKGKEVLDVALCYRGLDGDWVTVARRPL
jgi:hypothetical protein